MKKKWLNFKLKKAEPIGIDITGRWNSPEWDKGNFKQDQEKISGTLRDSVVNGVVAGNKVYLVMYYNGVAYYFAELEVINRKTLQGIYCRGDFQDRTVDQFHPVLETKPKDPLDLTC